MYTRLTCILLTCIMNVSSHRDSNLQIKLEPAPLKTKDEACSKAHVEVTVSCELNNITFRRLMINWWVPHVEPADMIALYITDPEVNLTLPVFTVPPVTATGWSNTPFHEAYQEITNIFTPVCLGYWVVYWRGQTKVSWSCLQTNPSWMSDHQQSLGRLKLLDLFIPGTHGSAAYPVTYHPQEQTRRDKYLLNQEESVLSQLIHGIRCLDLRVGYDEGKFYTQHDKVQLRHFQGVIDDVITFLRNSNDIVIMDLHRFPVGFESEQIHIEFINYLEKELSEYMATSALTWQASLDDVWRTGKRLIVAYNNKEIVNKRMHNLWSPVSQQWGDVRTVAALRSYLDSVVNKRPVEVWAAMAELTPSNWDIVSDSLGGLRQMATQTNFLVTDWFRQEWGHRCNIVAVDFFRSTGIVNAAIDWNLRKALCT